MRIQYTYSHREGRRDGELNCREKGRGATRETIDQKAELKIPT
jgi:hypothetical protein